MPDFDERLAELARHAETTGHLDPAGAVRARADRRRKRRTVAVAGLGVAVVVALTAGIAIAQPRPDGPTMVPAPWVSTLAPAPVPTIATLPPLTVPPAPTPSARLTSASSADPPAPAGLTQAQTELDYRRAYRIVPATGSGAIGVTADGRVDVLAKGSTFTTTTSAPDDTEWLIRVDEKGGSQCLSFHADGTAGTRKCSPSDASQRLRYYQAGTDGQGHPAYVIGFGLDGLGLSPNERFLAPDPANGNRLRLVDGPRSQVTTAWSFIDQGPSTLDR